MNTRQISGLAVATLLLLICATDSASARVRLESICSVQGQREQRLVGLGLVVGLKGSGDGGDYLPTIRALGAALKLMNNPIEKEVFLKETKNNLLNQPSQGLPLLAAS